MESLAGLGDGKILLLAGPSSFTAAYVRRSLDFLHIPVLSPPGPPSEAFAQLTAEDWRSVTGCIAADVGPALFADVTAEARRIPCLFVGCTCGGWYPGPYAWLKPPVASYQLVETLCAIARA